MDFSPQNFAPKIFRRKIFAAKWKTFFFVESLLYREYLLAIPLLSARLIEMIKKSSIYLWTMAYPGWGKRYLWPHPLLFSIENVKMHFLQLFIFLRVRYFRVKWPTPPPVKLAGFAPVCVGRKSINQRKYFTSHRSIIFLHAYNNYYIFRHIIFILFFNKIFVKDVKYMSVWRTDFDFVSKHGE